MANTAEKKNIFKRIGGFFVNLAKGIGRKFKEMYFELKKVTWPSAKDTAKNVGIVIVCVLLVGVLIWVFDGVVKMVVEALLNLF